MSTGNVVYVHIDLADLVLQLQMRGVDRHTLLTILTDAQIAQSAAGAVAVNVEDFKMVGEPVNRYQVNHNPPWLQELSTNDVQG